MTVEDEIKKLELVVETVREMWGTACTSPECFVATPATLGKYEPRANSR
jgi:hypothetical protein